MHYDKSIAQLILSLNMGAAGAAAKVQSMETILKSRGSRWKLSEFLAEVLSPTGPLPQITDMAPGVTDSNESRTPIVTITGQNISTSVPASPMLVSESAMTVGGSSPAAKEGPKKAVSFGESSGSDGNDHSLTSRLPPHSGQSSGGLRKNAERLTSFRPELPTECSHDDDVGDEEMILENAIEVMNSSDRSPDAEHNDQSGPNGPEVLQQGNIRAVIGCRSLSTMLIKPRRLADFDDTLSVLMLPENGDESAESLLELVVVEGPQAARKLIEFLIDQQPGLVITESLLKAVARNEGSDEQLMRWLLIMLLPNDYNIEISETLLKLAASNKKCGVKLVALLLRVRDRTPFTMEISTKVAGR